MQEKKGKSRKLCYFRCNFGTPLWFSRSALAPRWPSLFEAKSQLASPSPKIRSRSAGYTQVSHFLHVAPLSLLIIECLRVSGIACTLFSSEHITLSEVSRAVGVRESH